MKKSSDGNKIALGVAFGVVFGIVLGVAFATGQAARTSARAAAVLAFWVSTKSRVVVVAATPLVLVAPFSTLKAPRLGGELLPFRIAFDEIQPDIYPFWHFDDNEELLIHWQYAAV